MIKTSPLHIINSYGKMVNYLMDTKTGVISRAHEIILHEINRIPGLKKPSGASLFIQCPFKEEHPVDKTPSCGIIIGPHEKYQIGTFHCFGCGKSGGWNILAERLSLHKIQEDQLTKDRVANYDLNAAKSELLDDLDSLDILITKNFGQSIIIDWPEDMKWRGVPGELLVKMGAKQILVNGDLDVVFPVWVNEELVGVVKGLRQKQKGKNSYVNGKGKWIKKKGLMFYDQIKKLIKKYNKLVLVEGPRDALRLILNGIPAISILGIENWSVDKLELIMNLVEPENVLLCMDGDKGGRKAIRIIKETFKKYGKPKILKLKSKKKIDPANMPVKYVRLIKHWLKH